MSSSPSMTVDTKSEFPYWSSIRRRFDPDSSFFAQGNIERELLAKQVALDISEDEKHQLHSMLDDDDDDNEDTARGIYCPIVGCGFRLTSLENFEDHYNARHSACCSVCHRVYPTSRLLSIHVSEAHDSFFQAKVARGYPMYECLVEGCDLKFKSYKFRQQHLVDKHKFPSSFEFFKKTLPSKKKRTKTHRKQATTDKVDSSSKMEIENETVDGLVSAVSRLSTADSTPSSISFGRRHTRGLTFVPRSVQQGSGPNSKPSGTKK
ncbi:hypothetical protein ACFE04_005865 [Oxalis oulophora]